MRKNMDHLHTRNKEAVLSSRPLFSSAWLVLFSRLRQHYHTHNETHPGRAGQVHAAKERKTGLN